MSQDDPHARLRERAERLMVGLSRLPWRRGIGNDCHHIFDEQGSVVADQVGTTDGTFIAEAPAIVRSLLDAHNRQAAEIARLKDEVLRLEAADQLTRRIEQRGYKERAARYERALREIADSTGSDWQRPMAANRMVRIARAALESNDADR